MFCLGKGKRRKTSVEKVL